MSSIKCYDKYGQEIDHLTQWDINVSIKIFDFPFDIAPVCHFSSRFDKTSKTVTSTLEDGVVSVQVPNILLTDTKTIKIFVFLYDSEEDTGRTIFVIELPVEPKPKPDDYEYSDNIEIIEITALKARLEALIAQAEQTVTVRIEELANTYQNTITEIRESIADDVLNLNRQITNSNTQLINEIRESRQQLTGDIERNNTQLTSDITIAKTQLNNEIQAALTSLINSIQDGSPKGVFDDISDLANKPAGIYLYINTESEDSGYIYYWNGETLSNKLLHYQGIIINDGTITLNKLSEELKKQCLGKVIEYELLVEQWDDGVQEIDISDYYATTERTKIDIEFGSETLIQLLSDDCAGLYAINNENNDNKIYAHYMGNPPSTDIVVQLLVKETV